MPVFTEPLYMPLYAQAPLCRVCAGASACLFYFPCCLTCGWLIAFRVLTGPGAWLSSQPPWVMCLDSACDRVCVCVCMCVCLPGGWKVFDPSYLQHPGVFVFTATAQPQCWRHVTLGGIFHINHTHTSTSAGYQPSTHCLEQIINTWHY